MYIYIYIYVYIVKQCSTSFNSEDMPLETAHKHNEAEALQNATGEYKAVRAARDLSASLSYLSALLRDTMKQNCRNWQTASNSNANC
jgi:hypothetical protein